MAKIRLTSEDKSKLKETKRIGAEAGRKLREFNQKIREEREETFRLLKKIRVSN